MNDIKHIEHLRNLIINSGIKLTSQRMAVLNVLFANRNRHLTVEEIHKLSKELFAQVALPTVYRTVLQFEKIGILYKISINGDCYKYQLFIPGEKNRHRHFICTQCGDITDIEPSQYDTNEQLLESRYGISIRDQSVIYYGLCNKCINNNEHADISFVPPPSSKGYIRHFKPM